MAKQQHQHHTLTEQHTTLALFSDTIITSRNNPKIKQLRTLLKRPERERTGLALIEGLCQVIEALQQPGRVCQLIVAPDVLKSQQAWELVEAYKQQGLPWLYVSADVLECLSLKYAQQGIVAVIPQRWESLKELRLSTGDYWVALEAIQDPGNLGTILRTCDATGCRGLFLLDHAADPYDPVALRASRGAILSRRLVKASFQDFVDWKRLHHYPVIGTSDAAAVHYRQVGYPSPAILLMGSERQGLSQEQQAACDLVVSIPMRGNSDSLNVAVATAVVLYEAIQEDTY
ncbi:TrmH family RNA methyltransferase [Dictyobacter kobayashii]|uniref:rRNA methyltransferase n=1 Tax=Dictyobacter kobayashii TaxID=2014872 RepID=A0A402AQG7_9CHLR|nr:RNA methyltransferase [Dictyobacter kobayashii]GCE21294.1 rRNA methyltransferase [Dictyobacter kobayashii]